VSSNLIIGFKQGKSFIDDAVAVNPLASNSSLKVRLNVNYYAPGVGGELFDHDFLRDAVRSLGGWAIPVR
jgi:hypothetical protein